MTDGMTLSTTDKIALAVIESRIDAILPETYQESYDDGQPTAMGSAESPMRHVPTGCQTPNTLCRTKASRAR